jgi:hypothetical protein
VCADLSKRVQASWLNSRNVETNVPETRHSHPFIAMARYTLPLIGGLQQGSYSRMILERSPISSHVDQ